MPEPTVDTCLALLLEDDALARDPLEQAWQAAATRRDVATQHRLAALALLAYEVEMSDFRGLGVWLERFEAAESRDPSGPSPRDALRLDAARLALPTLDHRTAYDSPHTQAAAARLLAALRARQWPTGNEHALLAKVLHEFHGMEYAESACERVAVLAADGLQQASADWRARWWVQIEDCQSFWGHAAAAEQARDELRTLATGAQSALATWAMAVIDLRQALRGDDTAAQDRAYAQVDRLRNLQRPGRAVQGLRWQASLQLRRGKPQAALKAIELLLSLSDDLAVPERDRGLYHELRAQALACMGRWDDAMCTLEAMQLHHNGAQGRILQTMLRATQAAAALARQEPQAHGLALDTLRLASANAWPHFLPFSPELAARVADAGLRDGVETEFACTLIRQRGLVPPRPWREDWPWRLKVRAFGPLRLTRDDQALSTSGKSQRKPLELLAVLAAHGGRPMDTEAVIDELWPSLEANSPRASLDMAVSRLRKLLDVPDAVVLSDGRLSLNPARVWTDVGAFEALLDQPGEDAATQALSLQAEVLLGNAVLAGLRLQRRQYLLQRLVTLALARAQALHRAGQAQAACTVLQQALRCAPDSAALAEALLACQAALARSLSSLPG